MSCRLKPGAASDFGELISRASRPKRTKAQTGILKVPRSRCVYPFGLRYVYVYYFPAAGNAAPGFILSQADFQCFTIPAGRWPLDLYQGAFYTTPTYKPTFPPVCATPKSEHQLVSAHHPGARNSRYLHHAKACGVFYVLSGIRYFALLMDFIAGIPILIEPHSLLNVAGFEIRD